MNEKLKQTSEDSQPVSDTRRTFLAGSLLMLTAAGAEGKLKHDRHSAGLDRIAVMTLSFESVLKTARTPDKSKKTLDILDAPQVLADRFGIHHVELQHYHLESAESDYLKEFRGRLRKANSEVNQICCEFGQLNISSSDRALRLETIDLTKRWIDHAVELGCPRIMLNQGTLAPEVRTTAIETVKRINDYGAKKKVFVTLENRGHAYSATVPSWEVVMEVIRSSGIHANPDTGNFPDEATRAAGLRAMYPLTCGSSHAHYEPARFNEAKAIGISKELGYKGLYSIEATAANGPDPYAAVQTIINELLKDI
jgi:sugar phosphate isomerase/epimerase